MHALALRRALGKSVLAPEELEIGWSNSTRFFNFLWDELDTAGRELMIAVLKKAHLRIGRRIVNADTNEQLKNVNTYANRVLTREAVLAANSPAFAPHASDLKGIIAEAVAIRINKGAPDPDGGEQDFVSKFKDAVRRAGF